MHTLLTALIPGSRVCILFIGLTAIVPILHGREHHPMKTLFEFTGQNASLEWRSNNDDVMGGFSTGRAEIIEQGMLFQGKLSLKNNGGFSSIYSRGNYDLSDFSGIRLKVLGDGRTYQLRLESDAVLSPRRPVKFSSEFKTTEGQWIEIFLPFSGLNQTWRGRQLSGHSFNPRDIRKIGIMLADKKRGEFDLKIAFIAAN
ncbi:MAG: NADH dehydrogenase [ubiquinone] 1 alpha subcomplex assembly factor 1 [Methylophagaceae bacterium]|jgi:NADH dehydrogenase [ubiquinone] 1 alpha subcomplex assembly factor 1